MTDRHRRDRARRHARRVRDRRIADAAAHALTGRRGDPDVLVRREDGAIYVRPAVGAIVVDRSGPVGLVELLAIDGDGREARAAELEAIARQIGLGDALDAAARRAEYPS